MSGLLIRASCCFLVVMMTVNSATASVCPCDDRALRATHAVSLTDQALQMPPVPYTEMPLDPNTTHHIMRELSRVASRNTIKSTRQKKNKWFHWFVFNSAGLFLGGGGIGGFLPPSFFGLEFVENDGLYRARAIALSMPRGIERLKTLAALVPYYRRQGHSKTAEELLETILQDTGPARPGARRLVQILVSSGFQRIMFFAGSETDFLNILENPPVEVPRGIPSELMRHGAAYSAIIRSALLANHQDPLGAWLTHTRLSIAVDRYIRSVDGIATDQFGDLALILSETAREFIALGDVVRASRTLDIFWDKCGEPFEMQIEQIEERAKRLKAVAEMAALVGKFKDQFLADDHIENINETIGFIRPRIHLYSEIHDTIVVELKIRSALAVSQSQLGDDGEAPNGFSAYVRDFPVIEAKYLTRNLIPVESFHRIAKLLLAHAMLAAGRRAQAESIVHQLSAWSDEREEYLMVIFYSLATPLFLDLGLSDAAVECLQKIPFSWGRNADSWRSRHDNSPYDEKLEWALQALRALGSDPVALEFLVTLWRHELRTASSYLVGDIAHGDPGGYYLSRIIPVFASTVLSFSDRQAANALLKLEWDAIPSIHDQNLRWRASLVIAEGFAAVGNFLDSIAILKKAWEWANIDDRKTLTSGHALVGDSATPSLLNDVESLLQRILHSQSPEVFDLIKQSLHELDSESALPYEIMQVGFFLVPGQRLKSHRIAHFLGSLARFWIALATIQGSESNLSPRLLDAA